MAKNDFAKPMPAEKYPLGHAKENKDASAYTGFKYPSGGGKDIGVYKQPMQNPAGGVSKPAVSVKRDPNSMRSQEVGVTTPAMRVSVGNPDNDNVNPYGTGTMRGYGAATKGRKISGKMG